MVIVPGESTGPPAADAAVIERSWAEPELFEAIFRRYFGQIHQYLAARVGGRIADELAAEVFTVAFAKRQRYHLARECARPWLYGIATNLAGTYRRREQRRYRALARGGAQVVALSDEDLAAERVNAAAAGPALAAALAGLGSGVCQHCASFWGLPSPPPGAARRVRLFGAGFRVCLCACACARNPLMRAACRAPRRRG